VPRSRRTNRPTSETIYRNSLHSFYARKHFDRSTKLNGEDVAICYYCNSIAYERDHVPPLAYVRDQITFGNYDILTELPLLIVPACKPCNRNLAAKPLLTLEKRLLFIRKNFPSRVKEREPVTITRIGAPVKRRFWHRLVYGVGRCLLFGFRI